MDDAIWGSCKTLSSSSPPNPNHWSFLSLKQAIFIIAYNDSQVQDLQSARRSPDCKSKNMEATYKSMQSWYELDAVDSFELGCELDAGHMLWLAFGREGTDPCPTVCAHLVLLTVMDRPNCSCQTKSTHIESSTWQEVADNAEACLIRWCTGTSHGNEEAKSSSRERFHPIESARTASFLPPPSSLDVIRCFSSCVLVLVLVLPPYSYSCICSLFFGWHFCFSCFLFYQSILLVDFLRLLTRLLFHTGLDCFPFPLTVQIWPFTAQAYSTSCLCFLSLSFCWHFPIPLLLLTLKLHLHSYLLPCQGQLLLHSKQNKTNGERELTKQWFPPSLEEMEHVTLVSFCPLTLL